MHLAAGHQIFTFQQYVLCHKETYRVTRLLGDFGGRRLMRS